MPIRLTVVARGILLSLAILGAAQLACVGGHIPPSMFQFQNVVPYSGDGNETGGWKVAQVLILLSRISPSFPESATCDIEVGVPERNKKGWVLDEFAQTAAAKAADEAARIVLREQLPTALACKQFREHMERILTELDVGPIPGAKVTKFRAVGVHPKTFP
ncbi:hypothetical protein [Vitiosangium sp. GDMCC 1.1324]|uniref:hypothetical protein n=1 Tax=Vitiosangium sp. (strain GDMCC 1.1324) TaxID=2138576 RepID=UPI000D387613|nr:hypothetical protein [Vitiosangium sp. GDMCC 1.1324]PTL81966.1 hypothetical protein DAT35_19310 [Vitiosangium sp. GDMCC 1.1324]